MIQCHMPPLHSIGVAIAPCSNYKFAWFPEKSAVGGGIFGGGGHHGKA